MYLNVPIRLKLRSGNYIGLPIMFISLGELWPQVVQQQLLALVRQVEIEMLMVMEPLEVVELLGVAM